MEKQAGRDQRLLTLVGCIEGAVLEYDGDARCLGVWTIDEKLLGAPREAIVESSIDEILGAGGAELATAVRTVHRTGTPAHLQIQNRVDGRSRWLLCDIKRVEVSDAPTVLVFARDITDRIEAEEALRLSEERYRLAQTATNDVLWDWDLVANVVTWGESGPALFGFPHPQPTREWWETAMHPEDKDRASDSFQAAMVGGDESWTARYRMRRADGAYIDLLCRAFIVRRDGNPVRVVGSWVDMTEVTRLQAQLVQADRLVALGTLAAGVGHEINNPLCYVLGNLDIALDPDALDPDELREVLQEARDGAGRIAEIVKGLKLFTRSDPTITANVSLQSVVEHSLKMAENEIRHRARLVRSFGKVPLVNVSQSQLGQVCLNLIINAAQAIPLGSTEKNEICVATGVDERGRAYLSVSDTGGGIAPELLDRIFDPFFTTKPVGIGTGIGLAVCMNIVQSMNGELTVKSAPGARTTFTVSLPLDEDAPATVPAPTPVPAPPPKRKLLIIDDEPAVGRSIARALKHVCDSTTVTGGAAALSRLAAGERYDLVLCDVMMPEMTGIELYEILRERHTNILARMFFMTGGVFSDEAADFLDALSTPPLQKPIDNEKLKSVMR